MIFVLGHPIPFDWNFGRLLKEPWFIGFTTDDAVDVFLFLVEGYEESTTGDLVTSGATTHEIVKIFWSAIPIRDDMIGLKPDEAAVVAN